MRYYLHIAVYFPDTKGVLSAIINNIFKNKDLNYKNLLDYSLKRIYIFN